MPELVLFYSYTGNTKNTAEKFAKENNFDICEVTDIKRLNKLKAYVAGSFKSMSGGMFEIQPLTINETAVDFKNYDTINIFAPIWAGSIAPSMNGALKMLPQETKIKLFMVSASKNSSKDKISQRIQNLKLEIIGYEDIKK